MSDSVRPHRWQPTRLPSSWDSPGKNTGVGCHFFLQCMNVKSESEFAQSCPTLSNPKDCSLPGSSIHGIFQARVLELGAIAFSNILSRLVITFLPRSKRLLISWLQSPSAVILEPPKIKSDTVSPSISHQVMGPDAMLVLSMCLIGLVVFCEVGIQLTFPYGYQIVPMGRFLCPFSWKCPFWVYIFRSFFLNAKYQELQNFFNL